MPRLRFVNEWGPASVISLAALVGGALYAYHNSDAEIKTRLTVVETRLETVIKTVDRVEHKLDQKRSVELPTVIR